MIGPGKYGDIAERVAEETSAELVLLTVLGGTKGPGFSVSTRDPKLILKLPEILRKMADCVERDLKT